MVIDKLVELRLKSTMEESNSVSVIKIIQAAMVPLKQGNILIDRSFLVQISDLVESDFSIIGIDEMLVELVLENLIGQEFFTINHSFRNGTELIIPLGSAINQE